VLPAAVEVAAYRIVTEALSNVVRHAGAGRAEVGLGVSGAALHVEITDDGVGVAAERGGRGLGLSAMAERAAELGGTFEVRARDGGGTRVAVCLPLRSEVTA
jgi:signal transduction histidine kinase